MDIISIVVPTYNESKYIDDCIQSIKNFDIPKKIEIEIMIIDGQSTDNTRELIKKYLEKNIRLIDNPNRFQSYAMNIGIKQSKGNWILRLDAHSIYPKNYLRNCYETAVKTDADNVGGLVDTLPGNNSFQAKIVQALTTHKFGVGNSGFRVGMEEGEADTVPFGFFKKEIFNKIGLFEEKLIRCQDYEFNSRIRKFDGKIWLNPAIRASYYNQDSLFKFYKKQLFLEAPYNAYMWYLAPYTFTLRHAITGVFSFGFISGIILSQFNHYINLIFSGVMILYGILALISSAQQALRFKSILLTFFLPFAFFFFHLIHGLGVLIGIFKALLFKK